MSIVDAIKKCIGFAVSAVKYGLLGVITVLVGLYALSPEFRAIISVFGKAFSLEMVRQDVKMLADGVAWPIRYLEGKGKIGRIGGVAGGEAAEVTGGMAVSTLVAAVVEGIVLGLLVVWLLVETGYMKGISDAGKIYREDHIVMYLFIRLTLLFPLFWFAWLGIAALDIAQGRYIEIPGDIIRAYLDTIQVQQEAFAAVRRDIS